MATRWILLGIGYIIPVVQTAIKRTICDLLLLMINKQNADISVSCRIEATVRRFEAPVGEEKGSHFCEVPVISGAFRCFHLTQSDIQLCLYELSQSLHNDMTIR